MKKPKIIVGDEIVRIVKVPNPAVRFVLEFANRDAMGKPAWTAVSCNAISFIGDLLVKTQKLEMNRRQA